MQFISTAAVPLLGRKNVVETSSVEEGSNSHDREIAMPSSSVRLTEQPAPMYRNHGTRSFVRILVALAFSAYGTAAVAQQEPEITGELKKWHKVTLTFEGPETSETATPNPFFQYRLNVDFQHAQSGKTYTVPGYFAADGNAANTSATSGNKWRVHFAPDATGDWTYTVSFYEYPFVSVSEWRTPTDNAKTPAPHGVTGRFEIGPSDKTGRDLRGKGRLEVGDDRYLRFADTGEIFFKLGTDAPENLLAFADFDGTFHNDGHGITRSGTIVENEGVKTWGPHVRDWKDGDPTWGDGKGKGLIGAVNYLASKGLNAFSFLTLNIGGDDKNVFPYIDYDTLDRMDVSKLDQWEIVFEHATKLGMFLHFKTSEAENQGLLDGGGLGAHRRLYYRELIARFGHNLALNWNAGEEIGEWQGNPQTPPQYTEQKLAMAGYFYKHDPYRHHMVIHNGEWFDDIYGASKYTGISLQTSQRDFSLVHGQALRVLEESERAGDIWPVAVDEPGDATYSLAPDSVDFEHDNPRKNALWGGLLAGAWGLEWYFGYNYPESDLTAQDWRSRDNFWNQNKVALDFFTSNKLPYASMESHDELIVNNPPTRESAEGDYVLAQPGTAYIVFIKDGDAISLTLEKGTYDLRWYNPRTGGDMQTGAVASISADTRGDYSLGMPPESDGKDWVALVTGR